MRKLFYYVQYIHEITKPTNTGQVVLQLTHSISVDNSENTVNLVTRNHQLRCILRVLKRFSIFSAKTPDEVLFYVDTTTITNKTQTKIPKIRKLTVENDPLDC